MIDVPSAVLIATIGIFPATIAAVTGWRSLSQNRAVWREISSPNGIPAGQGIYDSYKQTLENNALISDAVGLLVQKIELADHAHAAQHAEIGRRIDKLYNDSTARFRGYMHHVPNPTMETDATGGVIYVNRAWEQATGVKMANAIGDGWEAGVNDDDLDYIKAQWLDAVRRKEIFGPENLRYKSSTRTWTATAYPIINHELKEIVGWISTSVPS